MHLCHEFQLHIVLLSYFLHNGLAQSSLTYTYALKTVMVKPNYKQKVNLKQQFLKIEGKSALTADFPP